MGRVLDSVRTRRCAAIVLGVVALAAAASFAGSHPIAERFHSAIVLTPPSLAFSSYGPGSATTFTASEAGYHGYFAGKSSDVKVATVTKFSTSVFTVTPLSDGKVTVTVNDTRKNSAKLPVQITGPLNRFGHLYVGGGSTTVRYPLVAGQPTTPPDANYVVGSSGSLPSFSDAAGPTGEMYFASGSVVVVYSGLLSGNVQPLRQLVTGIGAFGGSGVSGLAVHGEFLYVGGLCCSGLYYQVEIYEADAANQELPWQVFTVPDPRFRPASDGQLALDLAGNLYISRTDFNSVDVYATPLTQPTLARTITSAALQRPAGVAIGPGERLFVANGNGTIAVFPAGASGNVKPERLITTTNPSYFTSLALLSNANRLFVVNAGGYDILEFPEDANGMVSPFRFSAQAYGIAVGP